MGVSWVEYTIRDIASRAGVSKSTVSRVISGKGFASLKSREKVWKAIEELQYKPNGLARAMVSKRSNNIGVIVFRSPDGEGIYETFLDAIVEQSKEMNYSVFLTTIETSGVDDIDFLVEKRVDGIILVNNEDPHIPDYIDRFKIPYVVVDGAARREDVFQFVNQDRKGGRSAAEYLFRLGHRKIFIIAGPKNARPHHQRYEGFSDRIRELGGQISPGDVIFTDQVSVDGGYRTASERWDDFQMRKPSAIFVTDDLLAMGVMRFLLEKGIHIPEELSIMGFNGNRFSKVFYPSLTTMEIDRSRMGKDAVVRLDQLINKKDVKPERIEYEPHLVVRESTHRWRDAGSG